MTKLLGLRTIIYMVSDLEAAKNWYTKAFGIAPYFDEPFYVGFNIGGYELGLHPEQNANKAENAIAYWGVDDVESEYNKLLSVGATSFEKPTEVGGGIIVATVIDPWGNAIGLIYNPHFVLK